MSSNRHLGRGRGVFKEKADVLEWVDHYPAGHQPCQLQTICIQPFILIASDGTLGKSYDALLFMTQLPSSIVVHCDCDDDGDGDDGDGDGYGDDDDGDCDEDAGVSDDALMVGLRIS